MVGRGKTTTVTIAAVVIAALAVIGGIALYGPARIVGSNGGDRAGAVNTGDDRVAIEGYDVVAYFTEARAIPGSPEFSTAWNDAVWRFSSQDHRDLFVADPERYVPQYGGYCAWGVSEGEFWTVDPEAWLIVDGKLYLNLSKEFRDSFRDNLGNAIARADQAWAERRSAN
jgi:hypothetical protein